MPAYARGDGSPAPFALQLTLQLNKKLRHGSVLVHAASVAFYTATKETRLKPHVPAYLPGPTGSGELPPGPAPALAVFFGATFFGALFFGFDFCMVGVSFGMRLTESYGMLTAE